MKCYLCLWNNNNTYGHLFFLLYSLSQQFSDVITGELVIITVNDSVYTQVIISLPGLNMLIMEKRYGNRLSFLKY